MRQSSKKKQRILVTGGPTRAWLDRVRFLTNISSGELAYELCRALLRRGLEVALVSGPTAQPFARLPLARWISVETTEEMRDAVLGLCRSFRPHAAVFTAAVLDFTPVRRLAGKVTSKGRWNVALKPTPKIIDAVGRRFPDVRRVGFKLEWERPSPKEEAKLVDHNLREKKLDALLLNYLSEIDGSRHPARLFTAEGDVKAARTKPEIARRIADYVTT